MDFWTGFVAISGALVGGFFPYLASRNNKEVNRIKNQLLQEQRHCSQLEERLNKMYLDRQKLYNLEKLYCKELVGLKFKVSELAVKKYVRAKTGETSPMAPKEAERVGTYIKYLEDQIIWENKSNNL
jgi:hypothetical protein